MKMLAETHKKRSKKNNWSEYTLNPRGELWTKDESNFGNKLLKKMGWKAGEGLGKNRSGITKPIRLVETKNNEGLGFSKMTSDYSSNWLSNRDDFDSLLNQLQQQHAASSGIVSRKPGSTSSVENHAVPLAKRSKKSRKRVHYERLVQGKDMSNRSQADWKCVLGGKRKKKENEQVDVDPSPEEATNGSALLLHTSALSAQEYFMTKRFKSGPTKTENEAEVEDEPVANVDESVNATNQAEIGAASLSRKKKKKKKKRRKIETELENGLCEESVLLEEKENSCCQAEDSLIVLRKGKRKVKKRKNRAGIQTLFKVVNVDSSDVLSERAASPQHVLGSTESRPELETEGPKKKRVRFRTLPAVCLIPRNDPIRGGAGFWMPKAKRKKLGFKIRN